MRQIKEIDIKLIKPYELNPRLISNTNRINLYNSIKQYGDVGVIVVDADYNILSGHQRYSVFKSLGYKKVRCLVVDDLDEKSKLEFMLDINSEQGTGYYFEKIKAPDTDEAFSPVSLVFSNGDKLDQFMEFVNGLIDSGVYDSVADVIIGEAFGE